MAIFAHNKVALRACQESVRMRSTLHKRSKFCKRLAVSLLLRFEKKWCAGFCHSLLQNGKETCNVYLLARLSRLRAQRLQAASDAITGTARTGVRRRSTNLPQKEGGEKLAAKGGYRSFTGTEISHMRAPENGACWNIYLLWELYRSTRYCTYDVVREKPPSTLWGDVIMLRWKRLSRTRRCDDARLALVCGDELLAWQCSTHYTLLSSC